MAKCTNSSEVRLPYENFMLGLYVQSPGTLLLNPCLVALNLVYRVRAEGIGGLHIGWIAGSGCRLASLLWDRRILTGAGWPAHCAWPAPCPRRNSDLWPLTPSWWFWASFHSICLERLIRNERHAMWLMNTLAWKEQPMRTNSYDLALVESASRHIRSQICSLPCETASMRWPVAGEESLSIILIIATFQCDSRWVSSSPEYILRRVPSWN